MAADIAVDVEQTTAFALLEKAKLVKSLSRLDMVGFTICAFVGLDTLGSVAKNGPEGFLWLVVLAVVSAPYVRCLKSVGVYGGGGPYEWTKIYRPLNGGTRQPSRVTKPSGRRPARVHRPRSNFTRSARLLWRLASVDLHLDPIGVMIISRATASGSPTR
jgi:hypothetical protein